eukprot:CAMPEP_0176424912 /NCGR_PEP_ID=MMETSP0127-20121128/11101_1 /TAXON_ID=938130 /ORGANISM="Platyophrya macrostoma, Strain WH" /LENGTH=388 /DNA_ID=CAMNT_0017806023 /DNA_START=58 /DNA_END=1221 /DNA_ORIENTATION=+
MKALNLIFALVVILLPLCTRAQCNNTFLVSGAMQSSASAVTASICTNTTSKSCCTADYYKTLETQYNQMKTDLKTSFNTLYQKYQNIITNLTLSATPTQISTYLTQAYSFSKLTSNGNVFDSDYILATTDFVADLKSSLLAWASSYDTCLSDVMQHQAGLACGMCNSDVLSANLNVSDGYYPYFKVRWSVCNKLVHSCYDYLYNRVYVTNLANIALTLTTLINNQAMVVQYDAANVTAKYALGLKLAAISFDLYKFPDECVDNLDCKFICKAMIKPTGPVINVTTNPTDLVSYNTSFRRVLDEVMMMKYNRENPSREASQVDSESHNRRMLQSQMNGTNGFIYDVAGYDTYVQGKSNITMLDNYVGISLGLFAERITSSLIVLTAFLW